MKDTKQIIDTMRQQPLSNNKITGMVTDKNNQLQVLYVQLHDGTKTKIHVKDVGIL